MGFWIIDPNNGAETHVTGDPNMSEEKHALVAELARLAFSPENLERLQQVREAKPERGCPFDEQL